MLGKHHRSSAALQIRKKAENGGTLPTTGILLWVT